MEPVLRDATLADAQFLFDLRTDHDVVAASAAHPPVDFAQHLLWLECAIQDPDRRLFIIEAEDYAPDEHGDEVFTPLKIGQCRLDLIDYGRSAEVSIALIRAARGHGIGTAALKILALAAASLGIRWLEAVIKETNHASRKAFLKAGYSVEEIKDGVVHMGYKCGS